MLVLPQKIKVQWKPSNKKHYLELGYNFTQFDVEFEIDVTDLPHAASTLVDVECDFCNKIYPKTYKDYNNIRSDKYCCPECMKHMKRMKDENGKNIFVKIPYRDKEWLENEYIVKGREAQDIANECGVNLRSLREWIAIFDLTTKREKTKELTKDVLYDLYRVQHKSTLEIAKMYDVTDGTILYWLKQYDIPSFSTSEAVNFYLYEKGGIERARKEQSTWENRVKSSCRQRGIAIEDFDGFSTSEQHMARNNTYYKEWQRKVFERDDYTCQCCGKRGGNLNAHHLFNFSEYEDLRYDVANGITFCEQCHLVNFPNSFHSIYGEHNNAPEQVYEFIENYRKL